MPLAKIFRKISGQEKRIQRNKNRSLSDPSASESKDPEHNVDIKKPESEKESRKNSVSREEETELNAQFPAESETLTSSENVSNDSPIYEDIDELRLNLKVNNLLKSSQEEDEKSEVKLLSTNIERKSLTCENTAFSKDQINDVKDKEDLELKEVPTSENNNEGKGLSKELTKNSNEITLELLKAKTSEESKINEINKDFNATINVSKDEEHSDDTNESCAVDEEINKVLQCADNDIREDFDLNTQEQPIKNATYINSEQKNVEKSHVIEKIMETNKIQNNEDLQSELKKNIDLQLAESTENQKTPTNDSKKQIDFKEEYNILCENNSNHIDLGHNTIEKVNSEIREGQQSIMINDNDKLNVLEGENELKLTINEDHFNEETFHKIILNDDICSSGNSSQNLNEESVLNSVKETMDYIITQVEKQSPEIQTETVQVNEAETNEELTEVVDSSIYSDISEKIVSEAMTEAITEANLIMFDEADMNISNLQNEETLLRRQSIVSESTSILTDSEDLVEDVLPEPSFPENSTNPQNWKVGYLHVKPPQKTRAKGHLKAWQKRWVVIQADEFTADTDKKHRYLMLSIYLSESGNSRRHSASFWKTLCSKKAVIFRCRSKTHPYAFTVADGNEQVIHLAGHNETESQEWMAAIRNILWPPNPVIQLEKVLNGNEFDVSFVDNTFSCRAGLLGTYGCMTVTNRKLILTHPQSGYVIQEWYLNTVDKFHIAHQPKEEDMNKVIVMHTSSDSSTGRGELQLFCNEAVEFLKSLASTIHKVLQYYCKGNEKKYKKELDELAEWLTPQPSPVSTRQVDDEDYYKVPKRQVRSLLDIPNFIFDKPIVELASSREPLIESTSRLPTLSPKLASSQTSISMISQDSGFSTAASSSDFLNCSQTSFSIGEAMLRRPGRISSSSESSEPYSPPVSPVIPPKKPVRKSIAKLFVKT